MLIICISKMVNDIIPKNRILVNLNFFIKVTPPIQIKT